MISPSAILAGLPISVYVKDSEHRFIYLNGATAFALGVDRPEDALGKTDGDFFIESLAAQWQVDEKEVLKGGVIRDSVEKEVLHRCLDQAHWVLTSKYPWRNDNGEIIGIVGISKQFDEVHEELARNSHAVRGAQVGLWHIKYHRDGKREAWYSPRWKAMLGYKEHEIPNRREEFANRVHPDDLPRIVEARNRYAADPAGQGHYECEFRMKHKERGWIWIRSYGEAEFDPDGRTAAFAGSHTDVTEYRDEHELHEEILSMMSALVFLKDEQKRFIFVNPELAKYYGTKKESMEAERQRDSYYNPNKEQTGRFEQDDQRVLDETDPERRRKGLVIDAEEIINKETDKIRILKTTKKLLLYPSRDPRRHVLGISTDITEALQKTKREQDRLVRAHLHVRRFLAPLSSVQDLLDFRKKLVPALDALNTAYGCAASAILSSARPGEPQEFILQACAADKRATYLKLRLARVHGNHRSGITVLEDDPTIRAFVSGPASEPRLLLWADIAGTPLARFVDTLVPTVPRSLRVLSLAAGVPNSSGPKRLSDILCILVSKHEPDDIEARNARTYFLQRFTDSLAQYYRNSELYTERKEFLTDVTHQLVTPLINTIDICTATADKLGRLSLDQVSDRLSEARGLVRHCAMFTRAFLAASQSDEAELVTDKELNDTSVKVTRLMIEVGRDFRASAKTKGLRVQIIEDQLDAIGVQEIDEEWVRHALMNIVDNAVKYTATRSNGLILLFGESSRSEFALCVRNPSCIPIRTEYKERIFDRWFRAPEAEAEEVQGTGIGLALARAVVVSHGGRIDVEQSPIQDGAYQTTFRLWFPSNRVHLQ